MDVQAQAELRFGWPRVAKEITAMVRSTPPNAAGSLKAYTLRSSRMIFPCVCESPFCSESNIEDVTVSVWGLWMVPLCVSARRNPFGGEPFRGSCQVLILTSSMILGIPSPVMSGGYRDTLPTVHEPPKCE